MSISVTSRGFLSRVESVQLVISGTNLVDLTTIEVGWNLPVSLTGFGAQPTSWTITNLATNEQATVTAVSQTDIDLVTLTVAGLSNNSTYQLTAFQDVVETTTPDLTPNQPTGIDFSTPSVALMVEGYRLVDATNIIVTFTRPVRPETATPPQNYVFSPALDVNFVERVTDVSYLLHTGRMQPNQTYDVTVNGVLDYDGVEITYTPPPF